MKVKVYSLESGKALDDEIDLEDAFFNIPYDGFFMSMYFARMKKASYIPTNKTRNVSEISGSGKKPYKQKHTGNARQGSTRSAQMRGGGIAFGPRGVAAKIKIPKGETILAKSMMLSKALNEGRLFLIQKAHLNSVKTVNAKKVLSNFAKKSVLIINGNDIDKNTLLAVRNISGVKFVSSDMLTVYDLFRFDTILLDVEAVKLFLRSFSVCCCE